MRKLPNTNFIVVNIQKIVCVCVLITKHNCSSRETSKSKANVVQTIEVDDSAHGHLHCTHCTKASILSVASL